MNWSDIKSTAKEKVKGNKWNIWWPVLIIGLFESLLDSIFPSTKVDVSQFLNSSNLNASVQVENKEVIISFFISIVIGILMAGYTKYILNFIRKGEFDHKLIINTIKERWLELLIGMALTSLIVAVGTVLLVIPGIIAALGFAFVSYIIIDSDISGVDSLKKSWEMMRGYKWDYFLFILSFLGWIILSIFTLFILWIWLLPYMTLSFAIYYDKLKELKAKN